MVKISDTSVIDLFNKNYDKSFTEVRFLSGDVNKTYLLKDNDGQKIIFQKLAKIFNEKLVDDFCVISEFLIKDGWEAPIPVITKDGDAYITDEDGSIWRAITFVESDGSPTKVDFAAVGDILARLHKSLAKLEYEATFTLPHFHDTDYYLGKLKTLLPEFDEEDRAVAEEIIQEYESLPKLPDVKKQLIHADPRVANILFREGKPFAFIDFDTIMNSTIWIEIGDLVRSILENDVQNLKKSDIEELRKLSSAYLAQSDSLHLPPPEFFGHMLTSGRAIALELAMRFMIDIIEDFYFVWENTQYGSRHEHSIARVKQQLEINRRLKNV